MSNNFIPKPFLKLEKNLTLEKNSILEKTYKVKEIDLQNNPIDVKNIPLCKCLDKLEYDKPTISDIDSKIIRYKSKTINNMQQITVTVQCGDIIYKQFRLNVHFIYPVITTETGYMVYVVETDHKKRNIRLVKISNESIQHFEWVEFKYDIGFNVSYKDPVVKGEIYEFKQSLYNFISFDKNMNIIKTKEWGVYCNCHPEFLLSSNGHIIDRSNLETITKSYEILNKSGFRPEYFRWLNNVLYICSNNKASKMYIINEKTENSESNSDSD